MTERPTVNRIRHELVRRELTVASAEKLTPRMIRITLTGEELSGFVSDGFDDHVKITLPGNEDDPQRREYTPRSFDAANNRLVLDFFDHPGGPAADWARSAKPGDILQIGGPRGSAVIEGPIAHWLLIGDETALPAIARKVEETPASTRITTVVAVPGAEDEQQFTGATQVDSHWLHRPDSQAADEAPFIEALKDLTIPDQCFIWIATEARVAKTIRQWFLEKGHDKAWMKAAGYWIAGQPDSSIKSIED
ncbi:siderophore-interacting protein [Paracoccus aerodenitrificans]|uniref:siderophore-interacting protein n=1 Tax=Paracoccus aerodenitrificans TaxID=3017781 RepID=UPI0022F05A6A|nr:siderophore-interacting protein [Paracoccus aerodenitrificans]WBU64127.1 siderophore-interacting protein [Paracoccus aerodenitrificans]